jgi:hypothetical protein
LLAMGFDLGVTRVPLVEDGSFLRRLRRVDG